VRALLALVALALLWALIPSPVAADGDGVVEGTVASGSEGNGRVGDLVVTLTADDASTAGESGTRTNPMGKFRFEGLSTSPHVYTLSVRYQGVDYAVGGIQMDARNTFRHVELHVYDTTTSAEEVTVLLDHQIVNVRLGDRRLEVVNYLKVANAGDRTVVGYQAGDAGPLLPSLPEGADNVQFLGVLSETGHLLDGRHSNLNQAIPPGEHELLFAYEMSYSDNSVIHRKSLDFHTDKSVFLMAAGGVEVESRQMLAVNEADAADGDHQILTANDLPAGTVLEVTLTGLPAGGGLSLAGLLAPTAVIVAILVLGSTVAYFRLRRHLAPGRPSER
jgi:hypothetical protein